MTNTTKKKWETELESAIKLWVEIHDLESRTNALKQNYHNHIQAAVKLQCGIDDG